MPSGAWALPSNFKAFEANTLRRTPLPGEPPPGPQPDWLYVNPDPRLVNGSVIPPVVPNIIDIRWLNCPIKVIEKPDM